MSEFIDYKELFPELGLLFKNYDKIFEEYKKNEANIEYKDYTTQQDECIKIKRKGYPVALNNYLSASRRKKDSTHGWHLAGLSIHNNIYMKNGCMLPVLTETLKTIGLPKICAAAFNILDAKTSLEWHNDDEYVPNGKSFRNLFGIDCPPRGSIMQIKNKETGKIEERYFENNQMITFYHNSIHRVENLTDTPRVVLAIDVIL